MTQPSTPSRKGDWIQTFTGKQFWPIDPRPDDFDIRDIAHALSLTCRFTGHCREFYSVAQHSVLVARIVPANRQLEALLHDASEAYLADVSRPAKRSLPDYKVIESNLERCIAERFGLPFPMSPEVKAADLRLLATESRDVMGPSAAPWGSTEGVELLSEQIVPVGPRGAEIDFLNAFMEFANV